MQAIFETLLVVGTLFVVCHYIWRRKGIVNCMLEPLKDPDKHGVFVRDRIEVIMGLEQGYMVSTKLVTTIECSPRCVVLLSGPYIMAELWLTPGLVPLVARRAHVLFPYARVNWIAQYNNRRILRNPDEEYVLPIRDRVDYGYPGCQSFSLIQAQATYMRALRLEDNGLPEPRVPDS